MKQEYRAVLTPERYWLRKLMWGATPPVGVLDASSADFTSRARSAILDKNEFWVLADEVRIAVEEIAGLSLSYPLPFKTIGEAYDLLMEWLPDKERNKTLAYPIHLCRTQHIFYRLRQIIYETVLWGREHAHPQQRLPKITPLMMIRIALRFAAEFEMDVSELCYISPLLENAAGAGEDKFPLWRLWMPVFRNPTYADLVVWIANRTEFGLIEMDIEKCCSRDRP